MIMEGVKIWWEQKSGTRGAEAELVADVPSIIWCLLCSSAEQIHKYIESICLFITMKNFVNNVIFYASVFPKKLK